MESRRGQVSITAWLRQRGRSLGYAVAGLTALIRTQAHARIHLLAAALVVLAGTLTGIGRYDWLALTLAITGVWVAEAFNTALEFLADASVPERHPLIGHAKDIAAAAVLLTALAALVIAALVFLPYWLWY